MTIYTPPRSDVFAGGAPPSEIRPFDAWARGLGIAFEETNGFPELQSTNGLFNALNMYIKYLEQNGFAEWRGDLEYPVGAGVRVGLIWYRARTQNTNKTPANSQTDWELFLNASALSYQEPLYLVGNEIRIRDASNLVKGVSQFANASEIANNSNISKVINPANASSIAKSTDLGVGQVHNNVTGIRSPYTTYQNNTGKPIHVSIVIRDAGSVTGAFLYVGGYLAVGLPDISGASAGYQQISAIVPSGSSYRLETSNVIYEWKELS